MPRNKSEVCHGGYQPEGSDGPPCPPAGPGVRRVQGLRLASRMEGLEGPVTCHGLETQRHFVSVFEYANGAVSVELTGKEDPNAPVRLIINGIEAVLYPHHRR